MTIPDELPYEFNGMEIEFDHYPSIGRRKEIIQSLEYILGGDWLAEQIFDDRNIFILETDVREVTAVSAFDAAALILQQDDVLYVCPDFEYDDVDPAWGFDELDAQFDDSLVSPVALENYEWHLEQINAKIAWNLPLPADGLALGAGVVIGHLDTGYTEHYEFTGDADVDVGRGYNFYENSSDTLEPLITINKGHGCATGSVLVSQQGPATANPDLAFVSGISPKSKLIPIRVDKNVWFLSPKNDIKGIKYAIEQGCHVISMSRSGSGRRSFEEVIEKARQRGVIVVAAAGNCIPGCGIEAPAKYASVVCAGGTTADSKPWNRTSRGPEVDICAPAHHVWRARTRNVSNEYAFDVALSSGTSYATPLVAGAAALWIAYNGGHETLAKKLGGAERIPFVFQQMLMGPGASKPDGKWNTRLYGSGILDVVGLLKATLPIVGSEQFHALTKNHVSLQNTRMSAYLEFVTSLQDKRLLEDEINFLVLTKLPIAKLHSQYLMEEVTIEEFSAKLRSLLTTYPVSKLLSRSLG